MADASTGGTALIAFVGVFPTVSRDGDVGAAMVTDESGYPLEFRVTTAVRPTAMQKALYGQSLRLYIEAELIGRRLVADLSRRPRVVVVNKMTILDLPAEMPLAYVWRADGAVHPEEDRFAYSRFEPHFEPGAEYVAALPLSSAAEQHAVTSTLKLATERFDPIEVFERMHTAIDVLAASDDRYR